MNLIAIKKPEFDIELDLVYATSSNFTGMPIYRRADCYLHIDAAAALQKAITLAKELGYRLKVFDGFRPHEAQWVLWKHTPDPNFISNPETGSMPHCRGVAVDLTLIDAQGNELDMGTAFDALIPLSHHGVTNISKESQHNRFILLGIMTAAGWDFYRNEWWHYQLFQSRSYSIIKDEDAQTGLM
ncbi:MAG: D-alanyl-D-alanine dipeptidase [Alphaproteobacteria bacterium]|nr:D-alanyl-D-alanine dipeptidase [Alphaproteobacteria bacterium]